MAEKTLYIVATPIGNLQDITLRALEILKSVEVIFCEDTRQTRKLLTHYEIKKPLISLHQHTKEQNIKTTIERYTRMAYVTDAGTPGISDPGNKIVAVAVQLGIRIVPIPGPCAAVAALSVSGLPTDKFIFLGFLPRKGQQRTMELIRDAQFTVCFYESPHRIVKSLVALKNYMALDRQIMVGRELTKQFETIYRGNIEEVLKQVENKQKGEFVVIVSAK